MLIFLFALYRFGIHGRLFYGKRAGLDTMQVSPPFLNIQICFSVDWSVVWHKQLRDTPMLHAPINVQWALKATHCNHSSNVPITAVNVNRRTNRQGGSQWDIIAVSSVLAMFGRKRIIRWCYVPMLRTGLCIVSSRIRPRKHVSVWWIVQACNACCLVGCTVKWPLVNYHCNFINIYCVRLHVLSKLSRYLSMICIIPVWLFYKRIFERGHFLCSPSILLAWPLNCNRMRQPSMIVLIPFCNSCLISIHSHVSYQHSLSFPLNSCCQEKWNNEL